MLPSVVASRYEDQQIDDLLGRPLGKADAFGLAVEAFCALVLHSEGAWEDVLLGLYIPLAGSERVLTKAVPDLESSLRAFDGWQPPNLYLENRESFKYVPDYERYQKPIRLRFLEERVDSVFVSYVVARIYSALTQDDPEYTRSIRAEWYPKRYQFERK